jgi:diguanylate cyclase (GGDEF)-like protein/PAS domain S-box-containing protein
MRFKWDRTSVPRAFVLAGGILLGIVIGAGVASGVLLPAHGSAHALFFYLVYACGLLTFLVLGLAAIESGVNRQRMLDQDLLDMFLEHIPDNVFFKDRESRFLRISRAMAVHCNLADPGLAVHKTDADIFSAEHAQHALADELEIVRTGKPVMSKEERETWPDGHETWVLTTKVPLKDRAGLIIGTMGISHDITERKQAEFRVQHITQHDDLTGLPNRILLQEKLADAIAEARRNQKRGAILMLDLDRFRSVNDSLGHCMGDRLLQEAARRLREQLPETATVARLGGDEFAVVIPDLAEEDELERLPAQIQEILSEPFVVDRNEVRLSAGIGIAVYPENGAQADDLLRFADSAMYEAKRRGCGRHNLFSPAVGEAAGRQQKLESDLLQASARDEFVLHYQPFIEANSGRITGMEALLRWNHPEHGLIAPAQFIPALEKLGLMPQVGRWALRAGCYQAVEWQRMGLGSIRMAINVSPQQFAEDSIVDSVLEVLTEVKMDAEMLELELTESQMLDDSEATIGTLRRLKKIGVSLAIDDFGTGWSSLAYLRRFPLNRLKIDGSFVRDLGSEQTAAEVVRSVLGLGKRLGFECIAEGVETQRQFEILRDLGCPEMQGFFFSRPLAAVQATALLRSAKCELHGFSGNSAEAGAMRVPISVARETARAVTYGAKRWARPPDF